MNRICIVMPIAAALLLLVAGCTKEGISPAPGNITGKKDSAKAANFGFYFIQEWLQAPTPTAVRPKYAFGFTIGSKGYMGGGEGYLPTSRQNVTQTLSDFWQYDPASNAWTQEANLLAPLERTATFVVGTQGYIATGFEYTMTQAHWSNQLYQYDQASNTWTQKADLPAGVRLDAVGTSAGGEGYVGTGDNSNTAYFNDWWQYDPPTDHWTQKANLPGYWGRSAASSFNIGPYALITCGNVWATGTVNDLWMYIPSSNTWVQKTSLPAAVRSYANGFNYGSYGAVTCGVDTYGNYLNDFLYYVLGTNSWTSQASIGSGGRAKAAGFVVNGIPYIGTGETSPYNYTSDFWYMTYVLL